MFARRARNDLVFGPACTAASGHSIGNKGSRAKAAVTLSYGRRDAADLWHRIEGSCSCFKPYNYRVAMIYYYDSCPDGHHILVDKVSVETFITEYKQKAALSPTALLPLILEPAT